MTCISGIDLCRNPCRKSMMVVMNSYVQIESRRGSETNSVEVCPHISAEGVECDAVCDRWGYHLQQCPSGGGYFVGHDTVCAEVADLAGGDERIPGVVVDWKAQVDAWPRTTRGYEADVGFYSIPGERDVYVDFFPLFFLRGCSDSTS